MIFNVLEEGSKIGGRQVLGLALFEDFVHKDFESLPSSLALLVAMEIPRENFKARRGKVLVVPLADGDTRCIVLAGLGERGTVTTDDYRIAAYQIVHASAIRGASSVSLCIPNAGDGVVSRAIGEGAALAGYRFEKYHAADEDDLFAIPEHISVLSGDVKSLNEGFVIADCQCYSRDIANEPGNVINPETFEKIARDLAAECGFKITVLDADTLADKGMNALLAVGKGSSIQPRLIHIEYTPDVEPIETVALVGKGITFDSGGLSIKPADSMVTMKGDKTGACVVLGVVRAAARLSLPIRLHVIVGAAENMPGGNAYRPDDVIRAYNGMTIEVNNTDAEGRLTLADALAYASERKPGYVIDIATLTGACAVALGETTAGLFTNNDAFGDAFLSASSQSGERFWKMPMNDPNLQKKLKSPIADLVNSAGRYGGAITAAMFLEHFVGRDIPWIHLDIAAADFVKEPYAYYIKGATAFGVRTIAAYLLDRINKSA
ncbi:MAG: leucyl aminopeptidase [Synergistaceae bacterium]|nr:leucyl aminopeptidase [Synergistaceae bacterium]